MKLTLEIKAEIDSKSVYDLLYRTRFSPLGDEMMQGETGKYWSQRLAEKRAEDNEAYVTASKHMGR